MTRINTNVSSLNAQKSLARNNASLQQALTRLSTGLRINSGKDDPAGLIASEVLRADITGTNVGISNSERANQVLSTADSALGQVSSLLNDIRGLVSEAANSGAMSAEQIAANQLQIDSSLEAVDRIAKTTQFQGRKLLDGNLDFITSGVDATKLSDLQIDQANFGTQTAIGVNVDVVAQATQGQLNYSKGAIGNDLVLEVSGKEGSEAFTFAAGSKISDMASAINLVSDALGVTAQVQTEATKGAMTVSSYGTNNDIVISSTTAGQAAGNYRVKFTADSTGTTSTTATITQPTSKDAGTIEVALATQAWKAASVMVDDQSASNNAITFTALKEGTAANGVTLAFALDATAKGSEYATYASGVLTLHVHDAGAGVTDSTADEVVDGVNDTTRSAQASKLFSAANNVDSDGSGLIDVTDAAWGAAEFAGGVDGGAVTATANDVISAINAAAASSGAGIAAANATGNNGYGTVESFDSYTFSGDALQNNRLQFLDQAGSATAPKIRFTSVAGQALGVDLSTDPKVEGFSSVTIQGSTVNTSMVIRARQKGSDLDGVQVTFHDTLAGNATKDAVTYDAKTKSLDIYADAGTASSQHVIDLINNSTVVNGMFRAENFGTSTGAGVLAADVFAATPAGTTSGGVTSPGTVIINLATDSSGLVTTTANDLISYFNDTAHASTLQSLGISLGNAEGSDGTGLLAATTTDLSFAKSEYATEDANATGTTNAVNGTNALISITADQAGSQYGGVQVVFEDTAAAKGDEVASYDAVAKILKVTIKQGATTAADVIAAINDTDNTAVSDLFTAADGLDIGGVTSSGAGLVTDTDGATLDSGVTVTNAGEGAALLGNEDEKETGLTFVASDYGSDAFVSVKMLSGSDFDLTNSAGAAADRSVGTDVNARVNGIQAVGKGLTASLNTASLDLSFTVNTSFAAGSTTSFSITGGGATFQMGIDVVSNQQARMGISSVNTAKLGGNAGRLYELRSGGTKSLSGDLLGAAKVVDEVLSQVSELRGRLGAFQKTTLDTNIATLNDTLEALTQAQSDIRDADFAAESSNLTRAQILVQAGMSVLSTANQNPQSVLKLLQ